MSLNALLLRHVQSPQAVQWPLWHQVSESSVALSCVFSRSSGTGTQGALMVPVKGTEQRAYLTCLMIYNITMGFQILNNGIPDTKWNGRYNGRGTQTVSRKTGI